jgi:hypothetical protein
MEFNRSYDIQLVQLPGTIPYHTEHFSSPEERDEFLEGQKDLYHANQISVQFYDVESSMAGKIYRHYLDHARKIDEEIENEENFLNGQSKITLHYQYPPGIQTVRLRATRYLVNPESEEVLNYPGFDDSTKFICGDRRSEIFDYEMSITPKIEIGLVEDYLTIHLHESGINVGLVVFEDQSKLYLVNPSNDLNQPFPFQASLIIWNGKEYLL